MRNKDNIRVSILLALATGSISACLGGCNDDTPSNTETIVNPVLPSGWYSDNSCGANKLGLKLIDPQVGTTYSYTLPLGNVCYTFGGCNIEATLKASGLDWSSTLGIDEVRVVGDSLIQSRTYSYDQESKSDTGLQASMNPVDVESGKIAYALFCYDVELAVSATVTPSYTRTWSWGVDKKTLQSEVLLPKGNTVTIPYEVTLTAIPRDANYTVRGEVTVKNPWLLDAVLQQVTAEIPGIGRVTTTCPDMPGILKAASQIKCQYSQLLPDTAPRTITFKAITAASSTVISGTHEATVEFSAPTTLVDRCVKVSDSHPEAFSSKTVCADDMPPMPMTYEKDFGPFECGEGITDVSTASIVAGNSRTTGMDSATVSIAVSCPADGG